MVLSVETKWLINVIEKQICSLLFIRFNEMNEKFGNA